MTVAQASNPDFEGLHYGGYNAQVRAAGQDVGRRIFVDRHKSQNRDTTHVVSVVGWGVDGETELKYWIVPPFLRALVLQSTYVIVLSVRFVWMTYLDLPYLSKRFLERLQHTSE